MKLITIKIEKFRGIRNAVLNVEKELALVGQNSGGKSSILRALNAFFNFEVERMHFETNAHSFLKTSTAIIELEFDKVPKKLEIPRSDKLGQKVKIRLKYRKSPVWEVFNKGAWEASSHDIVEKIGLYIRYVYIPVERTDKINKYHQDSILHKAVHSWVKKHTSKRDNISPNVAIASNVIKNRTFKSLGKHLRGLTHINGNFDFEIDYNTPPDYGMLINDLVLRVVDGPVSVDISDCGSGTQSLAVIGLYSYLAESLGATYILGIEEPEQNLHPQAQRSLISSLKNLPLQVIFTTHSTVMIDSLSHEEVALCRRFKSPTRGFEIGVQQLSRDFWINKGLDKDKYYNFYKRRNSEFFFADFVILTESPIDLEVVRYLVTDGGLDMHSNSVSLISLDGVKSLPYAFYLLRELNIEFCSIVDKDYFVPYLSDELDLSRDSAGYPRYKKEYVSSCIIDDILKGKQSKEELLEYLLSNHTKAMNILSNFNIFCFRYSMDMDLVASATAKELLYSNLNIPLRDRSASELLVNRKKQIKKPEVVLSVVRDLSAAQLPNSYKLIRRKIPEMVLAANN